MKADNGKTGRPPGQKEDSPLVADAHPNPRQVEILLFLDLVGPADEGDLAYGIQLDPADFARIPAGFRDIPREFVVRRELETLSRMGLVVGDSVAWELTLRGRKIIQLLK
ncbi:MAG: hypothetical protein IBX71_02255 [Candidatus Desulforudis sp.]|nr:hypothetical protein [Desulforudis sp.]